MIVNMRDPVSILAWYKVWPERHGHQLAHSAKLWPQFADAIAEAGRLARSERASRGTVVEARATEAA